MADLPTYATHVKGHPPGMVLLLRTLQDAGLGGATAAAVVVLLAAALAAPAMLVALRAVAGEAAMRPQPTSSTGARCAREHVLVGGGERPSKRSSGRRTVGPSCRRAHRSSHSARSVPRSEPVTYERPPARGQ